MERTIDNVARPCFSYIKPPETEEGSCNACVILNLIVSEDSLALFHVKPVHGLLPGILVKVGSTIHIGPGYCVKPVFCCLKELMNQFLTPRLGPFGFT